MKKSIFIILLLLSILVSCNQNSNMPTASDNFNEEFISSITSVYHVLDPNLCYKIANPWEIKIDRQTIKIPNSNAQSFFLATINDTSINHFISITEYAFSLTPGGGEQYFTKMYQNIDAPKPMIDWTIESVTLLSSCMTCRQDDTSYDDAQHTAMDYFKSCYPESNEILTYKEESDKEFIDCFKKSYLQSDCIEDIEAYTVSNNSMVKYYFLLVSFKESNNIIWISQLYKCEDKLFFDCTTYDINPSREEHESYYITNKEYASIDDFYIEAICQAIENHK